MHKLYEKCCYEIDLILRKELTRDSVYILGELIDICKDICNMEYWKFKMNEDHNEDDSDGNEYQDSSKVRVSGVGRNKKYTDQSVKRDLDSMIEELKYISDRMRNTGSEEDKKKFKSDAKELLESVSKIKSIMSSMPLDSEVSTRYKELFK